MCDLKAVEEYNRLRLLYMPHLGELLSAVHPDLATGTATDHQSAPVCITPEQQSHDSSSTAHQPRNQTQQGANVDNLTTNQSPFQFCNIDSLDTDSQIIICNRMNLAFVGNEIIRSAEPRTCRQMEAKISSITRQQAVVKIWRAAGDGNCLFRALSYCITGSQQQYGLIRGYIVNHMLYSEYQSHLQVTFDRRKQCHTKTFNCHLEEMERDGTWVRNKRLLLLQTSSTSP